MTRLHITLVSDIICPWCFIGKKRLEQAIEETQTSSKVSLSYAPHVLYPDIPDGGKKIKDFPKKHGLGKLLREASEDVGISLDFKSINNVPNTLRLHYVLANLNDDGAAWKAKEALFKAYFTLGQDLTQQDIVDQIIRHLGYQSDWSPNSQVDDLLADHAQHGISAVPTFIINKEHKITGAQEAGRWAKFLLRSLG